MNVVRLGVCADLGLDALLLFKQHATHFQVADSGQHGALHDGSTLVILDISHPDFLVQGDFLCEPLFLEVTDGVVVGIRQEVHDVARGLDVVLEMGHEMGTVAFDLLVGTDGAEDDFGELATFERTVCDTADDLERLLDDGDGQVGAVVDESSDVIFRHLGQLFLEDAFQACEDDEGLPLVVVVHNAELYFAVALLDDSGLVKH